MNTNGTGFDALARAWVDGFYHAGWQAALVAGVLLAVVAAGRRWPAPWRHAGLLVAAALLPGLRFESPAVASGARGAGASATAASPADAVRQPDSEPALVPYQSGRPRLLAVAPGNGATGVPATTRIRLRFDRPMDPGRIELSWETGGFLSHGPVGYLEEVHEFVIPVQLTAGERQRIRVNPVSGPGEAAGFTSVDGLAAEAGELEFRTAAEVPGGSAPRLTAVEPADGSKVARVTLVRVRFEEPMDPGGIPSLFEPASTNRPAMPGDQPLLAALLGEYDAARQTFVLPVILPQDWTGRFELRGFRSARGGEAVPVVVSYSTGTNVWAANELARRREATASPKVREVVEATRSARRSLKSVSERVTSTTVTAQGADRPPNSLRGTVSVFRMQGERQFYGDVSHIMGIPFVVGSDGGQCWFQARTGVGPDAGQAVLRRCASGEVGEKSLSFSDPFPADTELEYLGDADLDGTRCRRLRAWSTQEIPTIGDKRDLWLHVRTWWIDAAENRVRLLEEHFGSGRTRHEFRYEKVNQRLPDSEFQPPAWPDVVERAPDALQEGYTARTLKVRDGSDGRMSVRWGMRGPKGNRSSGLN